MLVYHNPPIDTVYILKSKPFRSQTTKPIYMCTCVVACGSFLLALVCALAFLACFVDFGSRFVSFRFFATIFVQCLAFDAVYLDFKSCSSLRHVGWLALLPILRIARSSLFVAVIRHMRHRWLVGLPLQRGRSSPLTLYMRTSCSLL